MKTKTNVLTALVALSVTGAAAFGQGVTTTNATATSNTNAVFRVSFDALCQAFNTNKGRLVTTRLTETNIIAEAVGGSPADPTLLQNFALAYNAAADTLQVVDANLQPVVDVMHFGGGAAIASHRQLDRFTFIFFPGQTNEFGAETNVFGSAVLTERTNNRVHGATLQGPNLTARLQFVLTGSNVLGMTNALVIPGATNSVGNTNSVGTTNAVDTNNPVLVSTTDNQGIFSNFLASGTFVMTNANIVFDPTARICVGTFTTARLVPGSTPPSAPLGTNTNGVSTTNTTPGAASGATNGVNGTTGNTNPLTGITNPLTGITNPLTGITNPITGITNPITGITNTGTGTTNTGTGGVIGFNPGTGTVLTPTNTPAVNTGPTRVPGAPGAAGTAGTNAGIVIVPGS